jgi:glycosyltransferase involved in cell wall biosynthesis
MNEQIKAGMSPVLFQSLLNGPEYKEIEFDGKRVVQVGYKLPKYYEKILTIAKKLRNPYIYGFLRKISGQFSSWSLYSAVCSFQPDVVHQHDFSSGWRCTKLLSKKFPVVLTNHTGEYLMIKRLFFSRFILKRVLSHYKYIIGPSAELTPVEALCDTITIHNGVDPEVFYPMESDFRSNMRKKMLIDENSFVVFCPRRWAPTKGVIYLAKSISDMGYPSNFVFLFAGSDYKDYSEYADQILLLLTTEITSGRVKLLGNLTSSQLNEIHNIADVVVIPSLLEAVSLAAVESMASGCVVLSTTVGGMPELISSGHDGILVSPKDSLALHNELILLAGNSSLTSMYARNALKKASNYSWSNISMKVTAVYKSVIETKI